MTASGGYGTPRPPRRRPRVRRSVVLVVAVIVVGALAGAAVYHVSLQPGALIIKAAFEANPLVQPPARFAADRKAVQSMRRVALGSTGAHLDLYEPTASATGRPMVLWVHGGGFVSSSAATVEDYAILLASSGYVVGSLDYTLAPGAKHPTQVRQAASALDYLRAHAGELGGNAGALTIGGDSAGAQIASETAAAESNSALASRVGVPVPSRGQRLRGVILYCGLYDMNTVGDTGFPGLRTYLWAYTGHRDWLSAPDIADLSATRQATADFPPTFLSVGDVDPFRSQATGLADALRARSVPVTTVFWPKGTGLSHEYQFDFSKPQARAAFTRTLSFLSQVTR